MLIGVGLVLGGCTSPSPAVQGQSPGSTGTPTTLRLAFHEEPDTVYTGSGTEGREHGAIFHASLTVLDASDNLLPQLAVKIPTVADGDWKAFPDGSMEVTWQLKPGLKWHDGMPLSSEDFAFAIRMLLDEATPRSVPSAARHLGQVLTPDGQTLVLRYPRLFNGAAMAGVPEFAPVPSHLLADLYARVGSQGLANDPFWSTGWVGLGPFKMTSRTLGSHIEATAFDDYVFGRPRIDRLILRYIFDDHAIVANVLAGEVDMVPPGSMEPVQAVDLKQQWESAGRGAVVPVANRLRQNQIQFRDPSLPWASDVRIRQAMLHLIDRQALVDNIVQGLSTVADLPVLPNDPVYAGLQQRGLAKYPFDRTQGERLLDTAGWQRGADGLRRNAAGATFIYNQGVAGRPDLPETLIIVDSLKASGISSEVNLIDDLATDAREQRARSHGVIRSARLDATYWERFLTSQTASAQDRWRGGNTGGYSNLAFDGLHEQWITTLDSTALSQRSADLIKVLWDDVAYFPLYYNVDIFAYRKGLEGPKPFSALGQITSWNIHTWTAE